MIDDAQRTAVRIPRDDLDAAADRAVSEFLDGRIVTGAWSARDGVTIQEALVRHGLLVLAGKRPASPNPTGGGQQ